MNKIGCWDMGVSVPPLNRSKNSAKERKTGVGLAMGFAGVLLWCALLSASLAGAQSTSPTFTDSPSFVAWMRKLHKAPFMGNAALMAKHAGATSWQVGARKEALPPPSSDVEGITAIEAAASATTSNVSVKVNQDKNPWQKVSVAAAVDPANPKHVVVLSDDFRDGFQRVFYHVSTDGGKHWRDEYLTDSVDPNLNGLPFSMQHSAKIGFDSEGSTSIVHLSSNNIIQSNNGLIRFANLDTQIDLIQGFKNGAYVSHRTIPIDHASCGGTDLTGITCNTVLDMPGIKVDANKNSPNNGTTYIYYTVFFNCPAPGDCGVDHKGNPLTQSSAIMEWDSGLGPFDQFNPEPRLVSEFHPNAQFADMVIDSHGTPHIFFEDFDAMGNAGIWESTLKDGQWTVGTFAVTEFQNFGNGNAGWNFDTTGSLALSCAIAADDTTYCTFAANGVPGQPSSVGFGPKTFIAVIDPIAGTGTAFLEDGSGSAHLFPSVTVTPNGTAYVGWYDNRNDPSGEQLQYFVKADPIGERALSGLFDPCVGQKNCEYFGQFDQLASGPDGIVHATWADTRDGVSMQIYTEAITP
jgi:hypothetical protein